MTRRTLISLLLAVTVAGPAAVGAQQPAPLRLTLPGAVAMGRERGVAGALSRLNERVAQARADQRRADLLPAVTAHASYARQTLNLDEFGLPLASGVTDPFNVYGGSVRLTQTIFDASAMTRLRAARDSAQAGGADARAVGEFAAAEAGYAYLRVLSLEETVGAREADSAIAASLLDQSRQLVAAGVSPIIDATRSEVQLAAVRTQLEIARNQRDRARLDLARALDLPPETAIELTDSLPLPSSAIPTDPDQAVVFALEHRAEVVAERRRTGALSGLSRAIGREYLPTLSLSAQYNQTGRSLDNLNGSYQVQVQLSAPLLDGLRRPARQDEQNIRLQAQRLRQHDVEQQATVEAREALLDLSSADHQVALATDRLRLAEQELSQARDRFAAGAAGTVETTTAQGGLIAARDALIQARVSAAVSRIGALRALGLLDQMQ